MKRIKLKQFIEYQISFLKPENATKTIVKFISENYRRRKYSHIKGYVCNTCSQHLKPGVICTCKI